MLLFGHVGITLGAAVLVTGLITTGHQFSSRHKIPDQAGDNSLELRQAGKKIFCITNWINSLGKFMDIRLLILGSLLPDIIDKPIGMFFFGNGRIFTHSLLVTLVVLLIGSYLYMNHKRTGVLAIGIGMFAHLILDQMWLTPSILFWPLYGWGFPTGVRTSYLPLWIHNLFYNPEIYISEAIGFIIVTGFILILIKQRKLLAFLRRGTLT